MHISWWAVFLTPFILHWYHLVFSSCFLKMYSHLHIVILCLSKFYYLCMIASFLDYFEGIACDDQYLSIAFPSFSTKYCLTSLFVFLKSNSLCSGLHREVAGAPFSLLSLLNSQRLHLLLNAPLCVPLCLVFSAFLPSSLISFHCSGVSVEGNAASKSTSWFFKWVH